MEEQLPKELWVWILTFVPVKEILQRVSLVSSTWNGYSNDPFLWQSFCEKSGSLGYGDTDHLPSHVKAKVDPSHLSEEAIVTNRPDDWKAYYRSQCIPLVWGEHGSAVTLEEGNTVAEKKPPATSGWQNSGVRTVRGFVSGIHYWEIEPRVGTTLMLGVISEEIDPKSDELYSQLLKGAQNSQFIYALSPEYIYASGLVERWLKPQSEEFVIGDKIGFLLEFGESSSPGAPEGKTKTFKATCFRNGEEIAHGVCQNVPNELRIYPAAEFGGVTSIVQLTKYVKIK